MQPSGILVTGIARASASANSNATSEYPKAAVASNAYAIVGLKRVLKRSTLTPSEVVAGA